MRYQITLPVTKKVLHVSTNRSLGNMKDLCFSVFILRTLYGTEDFEHPEHAGAFQHAHHGIEYQRIYRRFYDVFDQTGRKHRKVALAVYLRQPERTEQHVYKPVSYTHLPQAY